jgi:Carboxypeptidase regulatory-like domain
MASMRRPTIAVGLLAFAASITLAQANLGTITGIISDPDGPVVNVPLQAKLVATGKVYTTTSAAMGKFIFKGLPAGTYDIRVPQQGIRTVPFVKEGITVAAGQTVSLDIMLTRFNLGVIGDDEAYLAIRNKYAGLKGKTPRTRDGKPDLSGMWSLAADPDPEPPALLPAAEAVWKERVANNFRDSPGARCMPHEPVPTIPILYKIVQTPTLIVVLFEHDPHYRQLFLDGRSHPKDLDPTWMGHSIAKWEGETLVVDTIGYNDRSWIAWPANLPHTEMLHVIERYRRPDLSNLLVDITFEDPGTFTKPLQRHMTWALAPGEEILEWICNENNKFEENAGLKK